MKETREILEKLKEPDEGKSAVLATVVDVEGSSFRLPGAKMLILDDGTTIGSVSGGCLEADVLERAASVRESGVPSVLVYDTTDEENSVFSLNMGCRGIVRILMERADDSAALKFLRDNIENSRAGVIATQITGSHIGAQVIVDTAGLRHSSFEAAGTTQVVLAAADSVLREKRSSLVKGPDGEVFFEYVPVPTKLIIFGAGSDAVPLARIARELGWRTHVIDHRPAYAARERFPDADMISNPAREKLVKAAAIGEESVAVVMTHSYDNDKNVLRELLESPIAYIGMMGPKSRTERILGEIETTGFAVTPDKLARIYGPVGLDIGSTTPEGIALSIAAEIQTFLSGRTGGFLKDREGSIYGRD